MNINDLCKQLANTSWLPQPTLRYLSNAHGNEAKLNLAWVLAGRPAVIGQAFFDNSQTCTAWYTAGEVIKQQVDGMPVGEYATLLSPADFLQLIERHPKVFRQFMPISTWQKAFRAK